MSRKKFKNKSPVLGEIDRGLFTVVPVLLIFGLIMIFNSTTVYAQGSLGNAYKLVLQQIVWIIVGLLGFFAIYKAPWEAIKKVSFPLFIISTGFLLFLALVSLFSNCETGNVIFTPCVNGAYRWFYLNPPPLPAIPLLGVLSFQPSEFAKLILVMYLALILEKNLKARENTFQVFITVTGFVSGLILLQPNMSTAALIFLIGVSIYFVSGSDLKPLMVSAPVLFISGLIFILSSSYRKSRLLTFLDPDTGDLALGYHIKQIQIALGSGGFWGVGFGQSRQKFSYLPEVAGDSIFAIIGEELGFIGTTIFVLVFSYLIYRCFRIAKNTNDLYSRMLVIGVAIWLSAQFFVNLAAMLRIIPLTGVPLPLVSYGGSSLIFSLIGLGLVAKVSSDNAVK